jgi:hypothetical protein
MNYIRDNNNHWTVIAGGKNYSFDSNHPKYKELTELVRTSNEKSFIETLSVGKVVDTWSSGDFRLEGGFLFYLNEQIHPVITSRILEMIKEGFDHKPMLRFLENLYRNTSYSSINELYTFLIHKHLPITPDGCFIAYKSVSIYRGPDIVDLMGLTIKEGDYVDSYTKKSYRNNIGDVPTMARFKVDDNRNVGCSRGLHCGALKYVTEDYRQEIILQVKVNPADVVSVPLDANTMKVRCTSYEVVSIYDGPLPSTVFSDENPEEDEEDEDEEFDVDYCDDCGDCNCDGFCEDEDEDYNDCGDDDDEGCPESDWKSRMVIPDGYEEFWPQGFYPSHFLIASKYEPHWESGECFNDSVKNPGDPQYHLYIRRKV